MIVAQVDGPIAEAFCNFDFTDTLEKKRERIKPYENSVASLLFLSAEGKAFPIEPAYLPTSYDKGELGLYNLGVDARFFISMSRRSILGICQGITQIPSSYLLPGILEISELVRVRWHMLIIMNKMLDKVFGQLEDPDVEPEDKLRLIVLARQWLAKSLDDPGLYIIAGDALSKIYKKLQDTFRLIDLRWFLFDKFDMLEKNYRDRVNLQWLSSKR